jgi:hypothetical protein
MRRSRIGRRRGCVVQEDEAGRTNRRMRRHGEAEGRCRRCEERRGSSRMMVQDVEVDDRGRVSVREEKWWWSRGWSGGCNTSTGPSLRLLYVWSLCSLLSALCSLLSALCSASLALRRGLRAVGWLAGLPLWSCLAFPVSFHHWWLGLVRHWPLARFRKAETHKTPRGQSALFRVQAQPMSSPFDCAAWITDGRTGLAGVCSSKELV